MPQTLYTTPTIHSPYRPHRLQRLSSHDDTPAAAAGAGAGAGAAQTVLHYCGGEDDSRNHETTNHDGSRRRSRSSTSSSDANSTLIFRHLSSTSSSTTDQQQQQQQQQQQHNYLTPHKAKREEMLLFFVSAIGCTLPWTAVLSNLVYYTREMGVRSYIYLNVAIYVPLFPISIMQALFDADFDRKFTSLSSFWVRGSTGFGILLVSTVVLAVISSPSFFSSSSVMMKYHNLVTVSTLALFMGTASGVLQGALKQMASFVYPECGRLAAAVTAGLQASAVVILLVGLGTLDEKQSSSPSSSSLDHFYAFISVLLALCWWGFQRLMTHSQDVYRSMVRRDSSIQLSSMLLEEGTMSNETTSNIRRTQQSSMTENNEEEKEEGTDVADLTLYQYEPQESQSVTGSTFMSPSIQGYDEQPGSSLAEPLLGQSIPRDSLVPTGRTSFTTMQRMLFRHSWPLCLAIFLTVGSSMAVASWFNRVPSANHPNLPQVLFYTRLFADLLGRPTTLLLPNVINTDNRSNETSSTPFSMVTKHRPLMVIVLLRLFFAPFFFLYCMPTSSIPKNDILVAIGVFGFAFSSGFVTTRVYQIAPLYCRRGRGVSANDSTNDIHDDQVLKQTNLLNVCFSASILIGLMFSLVLSST